MLALKWNDFGCNKWALHVQLWTGRETQLIVHHVFLYKAEHQHYFSTQAVKNSKFNYYTQEATLQHEDHFFCNFDCSSIECCSR